MAKSVVTDNFHPTLLCGIISGEISQLHERRTLATWQPSLKHTSNPALFVYLDKRIGGTLVAKRFTLKHSFTIYLQLHFHKVARRREKLCKATS
jgi:hypothetical protein